jgi:hypothetical protein
MLNKHQGKKAMMFVIANVISRKPWSKKFRRVCDKLGFVQRR